MEVKIDYKSMNQYKELYKAITTKIQNDYTADTGSYMPKEDIPIVSIICLLTKNYKIESK